MKKSVKRNARKSAKRNARKSVSTRKIKQRGGTSLLLQFICICLTIVHVLSKKVSFNDLFKGKTTLTNYQKCLNSNNAIEDPFTTCDNKVTKTDYDRAVSKGFSGCVGRNAANDMDVDEAALICYEQGLNREDARENNKRQEKCRTSFLTDVNIDMNCPVKVYNFNFEEKATINDKQTDTLDIYGATIPYGKKSVQSLVIGDKSIGFFSSDELDRTGANMQQIKAYFSKAMEAVNKDMSKYVQNIVFIDGFVRYIGDNGVVLEFHEIPSEMFDSLSSEHLRLLGESEEPTVFNFPKTVSKKGEK